MFKEARYNRISHNIVNQIRQVIFRGELKPGDKLPAEKELAERFGVSKATLREALRSLEALGLIEVRQGMSGGAFVREVDIKTARENLINYLFFQNPTIHEFTQLRIIIEPQICQMAAEKITDEDLNDLRENLIETYECMERGIQAHEIHEIEIFFHQKIARIVDNSFILLIIDAMQHVLGDIKLRANPGHDFSKRVYTAHLRIYEALKKRDPQKSRLEMLLHLQEVEADLVEANQGEKALGFYSDYEN